MASSKQGQPAYPPEILNHPSYHPYFTKEAAVDYVKRHYQGEGTFLMRPSSNNDPGSVSITTSVNDKDVCHARVFIEWDQRVKHHVYYISDKQKFPSFSAMLAHYKEHRIHCKQNIENIRLLIPLVYQRNQLQLLRGFEPFPGRGPTPEGMTRKTSVPAIPTGQTTSSRFSSNKGGRKLESRKSEMDIHHPHQEKKFSKPRSKSEGNISIFPQDKYANMSAIKQDVRNEMKCRPPLPLPVSEDKVDMDAYYTHVEVNKNFFPEIYQYLKNSEQCECGLRIADSELPLGWTVHRSNDSATRKRIFFQKGEDTTWEMPPELPSLLSGEQIKFIMFLCQEGQCPIPVNLRKFLDIDINRQRVSGVETKQEDLPSPTQSGLSSSGSGGNSNSSRNSSLKRVKFVLNSKENGTETSNEEAQFNDGYEKPRTLRSSAALNESIDGQNNTQGSQSWQRSSLGNKVPSIPEISDDQARPVSFDSTPSTIISSKTGCPDAPIPPIVRVDSEKLLRREMEQQQQQQQYLTQRLEEEQKEALRLQSQFQQLGIEPVQSSKLSMEQMQQHEKQNTAVDSFLNGKTSTRL